MIGECQIYTLDLIYAVCHLLASVVVVQRQGEQVAFGEFGIISAIQAHSVMPKFYCLNVVIFFNLIAFNDNNI